MKTLIIADKLNFLMHLTDTKNNMLGKAISIDPSYISRIRTGRRGVPKHRQFITPVAVYFARSIKSDAQRKIAAERICPGEAWPDEHAEAVRILIRWLGEGADKNHVTISEYMDSNEPFSPRESSADVLSNISGTGFYFGNAGKRECVIRFLKGIFERSEPAQLLLHSDEDMTWLFENPDFVKSWAELLFGIVKKGGKILIVHTVKRTIGEMMEAIAKWSPLYATGAIEPYYCPKVRDDIYHRTLFVARGYAAIVTHTASESRKSRLNILLHDVQAVNALEEEFYDYLKICRPLMKIFTAKNYEQILPVHAKFGSAKGALFQFHAAPSWLTLPDEAAMLISQRPGCADFRDKMIAARTFLSLRMELKNPIVDIIRLPDPAEARNGTVPMPMTDMLNLPPICYTAKEFALHIAAAIKMLKQSDNYRVILLPHDGEPMDTATLSPKNFSLIASEDAGVLLYSAAAPTTVFYTREQDMTASFCEYLGRIAKGADSREETIAQLTAYKKALQGR